MPAFVQGKPPDYEPEVGAEGLDAIPGDAPFVLHEDGLGWLYVPKGLQDGPFPTHYEPLESPVSNELYSRNTNPAEHWFTRQENRFAPPGDPRFPYVLTTYRLTEHHTAGGMSRFLSHLSELQPEMFAEISPELARELKIKNGDYICIVSLRAAIEARALVSRRIRPLQLNGKTLHQIAVPYHFGDEIGGAATQSCYFVVDDADAHYHKAKAAGADIVVDITDDDHGGRGYSCRDPEGHVWSFGTYDPWRRHPVARSRANRLKRPAITAAMLASLTVAAIAGWMLPRSAANGDRTRPKFEAVAAHERANTEMARAALLTADLAT